MTCSGLHVDESEIMHEQGKHLSGIINCDLDRIYEMIICYMLKVLNN